jgi:phenylacetate-CoA ligase
MNLEKLFRENLDRMERYYNLLPYPFYNLLTSIRGSVLEKVRYRKSFYKELKHLVSTEYASLDELINIQVNRLREMVDYIARYVPFYRDFFKKNSLRKNDFRKLEDIRKLPIIERELLKENPELFISEVCKTSIEAHTSGTSGSPLAVYWDSDAIARDWAYFVWFTGWVGAKIGDWRITCYGKPVIPPLRKKPPFWVYNYPGKQIFLSSYHLSKENIPYYVDFLHRNEDLVLEGFPTVLYIIADYIKEKKDIIPMKSVLSTGEPITDKMRKIIESAFSTNVYDFYGQAEKLTKIYECEEGEYHYIMNYGILEIVDEEQNPVTEDEGDFLCSGFINKAMPLLRYRIGDQGAFDTDKNSRCGRNYTKVRTTITRAGDTLLALNGRRFSPRILNQYLKSKVRIKSAQFYQKSLTEVTIYVEGAENDTQLKNEALTLKKEIQELLGNSTKVEWKLVDWIPRGANNKFMLIKSDLTEK